MSPAFDFDGLEALLAADPGFVEVHYFLGEGELLAREASHGRRHYLAVHEEDPGVSVRHDLPGQGRLPDRGDRELSRMEREGAGHPPGLPRRPPRQGARARLPSPRTRPWRSERLLQLGGPAWWTGPFLDGLEPQRARAPRGRPQVDHGGQGLPGRCRRRPLARRDHRLPAGTIGRRRKGPAPRFETAIVRQRRGLLSRKALRRPKGLAEFGELSRRRRALPRREGAGAGEEVEIEA